MNYEDLTAKAYHERTGKQWRWLSPTEKRKELEKYAEDLNIEMEDEWDI